MPACVLSSCGLQEFAEWGVALQGRFFDFGNKKARDQPLDVDVASGVPCGVAARRGMVSAFRAPESAVKSALASGTCHEKGRPKLDRGLTGFMLLLQGRTLMRWALCFCRTYLRVLCMMYSTLASPQTRQASHQPCLRWMLLEPRDTTHAFASPQCM